MTKPPRILFALPGLHRVDRGAEIAFMSVANSLVDQGADVTLIGSGPPREGASYRYLHARARSRERFEGFPTMPSLRGDTSWEELSFLPAFLTKYRPTDYDATLTCSYPWLNWVLRARRSNGYRPKHIFVTQNGDWPARGENSEYRFFGCEGLICTNPDYFESNRERYLSALIPNGVDLKRFRAGRANRHSFGLPESAPLVLMASALITSKFVDVGIDAVSRIPGAHLAVAGDGPLRDEMKRKADHLMPGRYHNFTVTADRMPDLYRSADLFLHLSRDESFGNVFVEAMAAEIPTVAWDLDRTRWIVGDTAYLVSGGSIDHLQSAIESAFASRCEAGKLAERAEVFSWSSIGQQYRDFIDRILA